MSNQSASRAFRSRVGLPPLDEAENPNPELADVEEVETEEVETELDPDEDMGRGEPPEDPERDVEDHDNHDGDPV